jgi:hypothetical protein
MAVPGGGHKHVEHVLVGRDAGEHAEDDLVPKPRIEAEGVREDDVVSDDEGNLVSFITVTFQTSP